MSVAQISRDGWQQPMLTEAKGSGTSEGKALSFALFSLSAIHNKTHSSSNKFCLVWSCWHPKLLFCLTSVETWSGLTEKLINFREPRSKPAPRLRFLNQEPPICHCESLAQGFSRKLVHILVRRDSVGLKKRFLTKRIMVVIWRFKEGELNCVQDSIREMVSLGS